MSLWIKICGNTSLEDALVASNAGADAVGFVFAASPRLVTPAEVAAITPYLPAQLEKIGVFVDAPFDVIYATVRTCGLTGVQLHFEGAPDLPARLHALLGPSLRILRVVHFHPEAAKLIATIDRDPHVDAVLIDSRTTTAVGGTGVSFDWDEAGKSIFHRARGHRRIAAGGLNPENVHEAIAKLRPWGVDVVSGVEASPGRKDPEKVRALIERARRAGAELSQAKSRARASSVSIHK